MCFCVSGDGTNLFTVGFYDEPSNLMSSTDALSFKSQDAA